MKNTPRVLQFFAQNPTEEFFVHRLLSLFPEIDSGELGVIIAHLLNLKLIKMRISEDSGYAVYKITTKGLDAAAPKKIKPLPKRTFKVEFMLVAGISFVFGFTIGAVFF